MDVVDLRELSDESFEVRFGGVPGRIAVETMSEALLGFKTALEEINRLANPDFELQVYVETITPGSIRFGLKLTKKRIVGAVVAGAVATVYIAKDVVVELFSSYLYDTLKADPICKMDVQPDGSLVFEANTDCRIVLSKEAADRFVQVQRDPTVASGVGRAMTAVEKDKEVTAVEVAPRAAARPVVKIDRGDIKAVQRRLTTRIFSPFGQPAKKEVIPDSIPTTVPKKRTQNVRANLVIIKAVLLRSKRKWQFNWQGYKVSAPIKDSSFFDQLEAGVAIHQGDALDADLVIHQEYLEGARVWQNKSYEVIKVYSVTAGETQSTMTFKPM